MRRDVCSKIFIFQRLSAFSDLHNKQYDQEISENIYSTSYPYSLEEQRFM